MRLISRCLQAASLALIAGLANSQTVDTYDAHYARAKELAGTEYAGLLRQCTRVGDPSQAGPPPAANAGPRPAPPPVEPAKVFDNLYYVGTSGVSSWAITTSQGIILIDDLNNGEEARTFIDGGLRKLGLNPADIKIVILTHGHGDHFGGSLYLREAHKARFVASASDWDLMASFATPQKGMPAGWGKLIPPRDIVATEGGKVTLGDTTIDTFVTPGHTPGSLSLLVPVKDNGVTHLAAMWGGVGFNFDPTPERFAIYAASAERFAGITRTRGADVVISNHPGNTDTFGKIATLKTRKPGAANPFVVGTDSAARFTSVLGECARAARAKVSQKP